MSWRKSVSPSGLRPPSALLDGWPQLSDEARAAACVAWRGLIVDPACLQWTKEWVRHAQFCQFLHGLAGRNEELRSWFNALSEMERARLHSRLADQTPDTLMDLAGQALEKMSGTAEEKAARRASVFTALVASPMGGSPGCAADRLYLSLPSAAPDEFLKLEESLCQARPDDKWLILAFVRMHAAAEAWPAVLARTTAALSAEKPARGSAWAPLIGSICWRWKSPAARPRGWSCWRSTVPGCPLRPRIRTRTGFPRRPWQG